MFSNTLSPYLDAELAYRNERRLAGQAHTTNPRRRRVLGPALSRTRSALVHRPAHGH